MKLLRIWVFVAILAVASISAFIFRDFIKEELLVPIVYALWIAQLYIESVPQVFVWIFLIIIVAILLAKGLLRMPKSGRSRGILHHRRMGPVETWLEWIDRAKRGRYFRSRLARRLAELTIDSLAFEKRISEQDIERGLQHGVLDIPEDLQHYLQRGLARESWSVFYGRLEGVRNLVGQQSATFEGMKLDEVVTKLENTLKRG